MSNKTLRKPRNKMAKKVLITTIPITLEQLGTKDDPCFAKLHDPRAPECQRCGDAEICAIAMGQKNHLLRAEEESNKNFKDIEEVKIKPTVDKKVLRKSIRNRVREMVKMGGGKSIELQEVVDDISASYAKDGFSKVRIRKMIIRVAELSDRIILNQNKLKWKL